ncbi:transcriptional regulator NikR, CopG family [Ferroglobus placidus DSM 10642]|uniref:Putative nickel-responsive regulator n=1 Tax=Ferroglobus placidus (strain DSM 10642 / AEDII12DO) TaxID=589924 RepID=D3S0V8_FERPA|nr:nickel-responsive transcriptional regulator NikR [Ferroglobus placidus]ADC66349.1 transcriptional regulator NikR, CopG family [Ferroglobus placidus DSM 10642]
MEEITRIGVSLPKNLLEEFDSIIGKRGYSSRSEAIRDAIRSYIIEYKWLEKEEGEAVGVLNVVYDHEVKGVSDTLIDLQHEFSDIILASLHLHLKRDLCLEMIILRGDMKRIKEISDKVSAVKGVRFVKFLTAFKE